MFRFHQNKTSNPFGTEVHEKRQISSFHVLAHKIICLDGAINKLKDYFENGETISRGPDYIIGDFDSIDPESVNWLNDKVNAKCNRLTIFVVWERFLYYEKN